MSTYIMYGYCPPPESKGQSGHFSCFVKGDITPEQIASVKASLLQGKYFFPSEVGLPEVRPNSLPESQRRVIMMHDVEGCDNSEIVETTGMSAENVRQLLSRARRFIRSRFAKH